MMKKLKFLALLLLPLFLAIIIPNNVEAAGSGCGYITFNQYIVTGSGGINKDTKETVRSPKLCISNLDDNGNITKDSELTKTSQGWDLFNFMLLNKKQTKLVCNEKAFLGINAQCSDTTYSLDDSVNQRYSIFFNHFESPIKSYYNKDSDLLVRDQVNGQAVAYEFSNVVSESLNATDPNDPNSDNPGGTTGENGENGEDGENGENQEEQDPTQACYDSGIDSMGWLVCPTINNTSQAADGIMGIITEWFRVDPDQVFKEDITRNAWEIFRNIANIMVTIILIIIIFSQVTGYGIDNYGIKKALPRLIAVAILINFSYIICQVIVDLSNIVGQGLYELFRNASSAITGEPMETNIVPATILAIVAGVATLAVSASMGVAAILSLLLAVLLALVSILLFFVMLAIRQMAVIILVIIAPVAFACCILPNTQNLFNKWWKILQACILLFPICGALYGLSFVISAIAEGNQKDLIWQLIAICAPFLPFLAAPTLLKNAIAGLGVIGGAITAVTSGAKGIAKTGVTAAKKTDTFKGIQDRDRQRNNLRRGGLDDEYNISDKRGARLRRSLANSGFGRALGMDKNMARYRSQALDDQKKNISSRNLADDAGYNRIHAQQNEEISEAERKASRADIAAGNVPGVDINDRASLGRYEELQLAAAHHYNEQANDESLSDRERKEARENYSKAMSNVNATIGILMGQGEGGRQLARQKIENAVTLGQTGGVHDAARYMIGEHNDLLHSTNLGYEDEMRTLATQDPASYAATVMNSRAGGFDRNTINNYSAETLAKSDEQVKQRFANMLDNPDAYGLTDKEYNRLVDMSNQIKNNNKLYDSIKGDNAKGYIDSMANKTRRQTPQPGGGGNGGNNGGNGGNGRNNGGNGGNSGNNGGNGGNGGAGGGGTP